MTAPAVALGRFWSGCVLGAGLGIWYDFLRPPRGKHTALCDLLFLIGALWCFLILGFQVCGGDLRLGYTSGLFLGGLAWEWSLGRLMSPLFASIWQVIGRIWRIICLPMKKISIFAKFLFASAKKWVTIKCNNRRRTRRTSGGHHHGRNHKSLPQCSGNTAHPCHCFSLCTFKRI